MRSVMRAFRSPILLFLPVLAIAAASQAARFLVVDHPEKSDAIVVLAGETQSVPTTVSNCCGREWPRICCWTPKCEIGSTTPN